MVSGGTVSMTGGRVSVASINAGANIPARGVWITGGTFTLGGSSSSSYGTINCTSPVNTTSTNSIGVLINGGTFNLQGFGHIYTRYCVPNTASAIGYSIYKSSGTYSKSGSPTITGTTYGI